MAGLEDFPNYRYSYDPNEREFYDSQSQYRYQSHNQPQEFSYGSSSYNKREVEYRTPRPLPDYSDDDSNVKKYIGVSVGLVSLITENLLSHPFVVLRRQCQVHHSSLRYHLVPLSLFPVIIHLHQRQGLTTLWKGIGSVLMVRGLSLAVEDLITKITPWPKEIDSSCSLKAVGQHLLLKCVSLAVIMPFYSASLVETVQSDIASEKPGLLDVFREGALRLVAWGVPQKGRMLPVWALVLPTVACGLAKYIVSTLVRGISFRVMEKRYKRAQAMQGAVPKDSPSSVVQEIQLNSTLLSIVAADILFYPFETIIHRLHLQGTRTIIDNLDTGYSVVPILTSYEGATDCYQTAISSEGMSGLYKGFGALVLQFGAHYAVIKLSRWLLTEITMLLRQSTTPATVTKTTEVAQNPDISDPYAGPSYPQFQHSQPAYFIP